MMRIHQLSKSDASGGGASKVAVILNEIWGKTNGIISHHWSVQGQDHAQHTAIKPLLPKNMDVRLARRLAYELGFPDQYLPTLGYYQKQSRLNCDLIHLHDTYQAFSTKSLLHLAEKRPIVFTIHDCSAATGGCLYPLSCGQHRTHCRSCPSGFWHNGRLRPRVGRLQQDRRTFLQHRNVHLVTPSQWMARFIADSGHLNRKPVRVIQNPLRDWAFFPRASDSFKLQHGISADVPVVALSASSLQDSRKDIRTALAALAHWGQPYELILIGAGDCGAPPGDCRKLHQTGYLRDDAIMADWLAAADVLLFPTLADNLPNTILEARAVGTYVIAANVGGIPDLLPDDRCGSLVPVADAQAMATALQRLFSARGESTCTPLSAQHNHQVLHQYRNVYATALRNFANG